MADVVLGIGSQKSALDVVGVCNEALTRTHGSPRKITAKSGPVEIIAERPEFEGPFDSISLRVRCAGDALEALQSCATELGSICHASEDGAWHVYHLKADGEHTQEALAEAVEALSSRFRLPEVWRIQGDRYRADHVSVELLFQAMVQYKASDVHLSPGDAPVFRIDSQTRHSELIAPLSASQIIALLREVAPEQDWNEFQETKQASFNFHQVGIGYSRVSAFIKSGAPHITFRFLPEVVPSFEDLNVPRGQMEELATLHHGLVLVTGMTGSGKTTTVAALVDWINSTKSVHILTIENPIEYVHNNKKSVMSQRGLGTDVATFNLAVTGALRHDPDVIVIGEMRDPDTIRSAINAAATGHLVISTLHSNTASEVINRIVSFFDPVERDLVRIQLRDAVRCIICQRLVPRIGGGRVPALEMLFNDIKPINDGVLEGNSDAIRIGMQQKISHSFLFEDYLHRLYKDGKIDLDNARLFSTEKSILDQMLMGTYSIPRLDSIKAAAQH